MNIFKKLLLTYIGITLLTLVVLGLLMSFLFEDFYFTEKKNALLDHGRHVNNIILKWDNKQINKEQVLFNLVSIDRFLTARIVVINSEGFILFDTQSYQGQWQGAGLQPEEFKEVLKGKVITKRGTTGSQFDTATLTVALPMFINEQIEGVILMNTPIYGISTSLKQVYRLFFIGALISLLMAFILSVHVSMMATKPLRKMNQAALEMARGKLDTQVDVVRKDEMGQLARNLNYMASELSKMEQMRKEFVANVSHELRSPITSIRGFIQAMMDGTIPQEGQGKYLQIVFDETNRLNRLINELLDLARIEAGNFDFEPQQFDLNAVIRRVGDRFYPLTNPRNVTMQVPEEQPLLTYADRDRVEQIIVNLVDNAVRFTPEGGQISLITELSNEKVTVRIRDTGVGMPEDELPYIWQRFHKVDKARTRTKKGGTGLGLAIVKHLIDAFGETITVTSKEGEGTEFSFTLPHVKTV